MPRRRTRLLHRGPTDAAGAGLRARFDAIRSELGVPASFPDEVLAEAQHAATGPVDDDLADLTALPFVTVDPKGATDLDQAMHLERRDGGYRVDYAIADVPSFVRPGGAVDVEARRRGQTIYAPDQRTPLHPPVLSEAAASLLPGQDRPAFVWRFDLDSSGEVVHLDLVRARVRSRRQLDYDQVQAAADADPGRQAGNAAASGGGGRATPASRASAGGPADVVVAPEAGTPAGTPGAIPAGTPAGTLEGAPAGTLEGTPAGTPAADADLAELAQLLREIGEHRQALELARGGASLPLPEQEVHEDGGAFTLTLRTGLPAEDWNAQLSLMTGMAAAGLMLKAGIGVLRTMPAPDQGALRRFREQTVAARVPWPADEPYGAFLRRLDSHQPEQLSLLFAAASLFRGAGYTPFDGAPPAQPHHAAVAAAYAHVTAPLRRLVDRFGLVCAYSAQQGRPVPGWVADALPLLPAAMTASDHLAGEVERRCVDAVELAVLSGREAETFDAIVVAVDRNGEGGRVQLVDPPVLSRCVGALTAGSKVRVRLDPVAPDATAVQFHLA